LQTHGPQASRYGKKAELQTRVIELLKSDKKQAVAEQVIQIYNRLHGIKTNPFVTPKQAQMVRGSSGYASSSGRQPIQPMQGFQ
jgi:hypothetical protein